ncbi:hypothetical protein [Streptomyces sp. NPDC087300]|uniref:hypothetical protein n=1 Tax=Streptomyces sp. NPDC087300 TaxID=3365780 RepID=UPI0037FB6A8F
MSDLSARADASTKATLRSHAQLLAEEADKAGQHLTAVQRHEVDRWVRRDHNAQNGIALAAPAHPAGQGPASSKPGTAAGTGKGKPAVHTVTVWVWKGRYGGLRADHQTRPEAAVRHVPLPNDTGPLQRLYGNLTRMIVEREAADGPVHTQRGTLPVRL